MRQKLCTGKYDFNEKPWKIVFFDVLSRLSEIELTDFIPLIKLIHYIHMTLYNLLKLLLNKIGFEVFRML